MKKSLSLALVGATGFVGHELIRILDEKNFPKNNLHAFASQESLAEGIEYGDSECVVEELSQSSFEKCDLAIFCTPQAVSEKFIPIALHSQCCVIDTSPCFRLHERSRLIVPDCNCDDLVMHEGLICLPSSPTTSLLTALLPIHDEATITRCILTCMQSVSKEGKKGLSELDKQISDLFQMQDTEHNVFSHQIAFNVIPFSGKFCKNEYTSDETAIEAETKKILDSDAFPISATCVVVPTFFGCALSVTFETKKALTSNDVRALLATAKGVHIVDNPKGNLMPTMLDCGGEDTVFVGRIRQNTALRNAISLWIVCDNQRKGSATSAYQIAKELMDRDLVRCKANLLD